MDTIAAPTRGRSTRRWLSALVGALAALLVLGLIVPVSSGLAPQSTIGGGFDTLVILALPAYLAGAQRHRVIAMSLAFFLGLATTMVVLGASFSALGALVFPYRETITRVGGLVIVGFGVMSVLGRGFSGMQLHDRPAATLAGTYLYGLTFAFGWTACVGPILGAILTTLVASGLSVLAGAALAFLYALDLATPLVLLATFFGRVGHGTRLGTILRGRGFSVVVGGRTLHLHTTSLISGVLLIAVGAMLATGQLTWLTRQWAGGAGGKIAWPLERRLSSVFHLGW